MRRDCVITSLALASVLALASSIDVLACSRPFERQTIRALGAGQIVILGTVGERVAGGRLFYVERWYSGGPPGTPIVIGFKEGEPLGDCSYPVSAGERKIIAPVRQPDGTLYADLVTLQADPMTPDGQRYLAEAESLFGPGVAPEPIEPSMHTAEQEPHPLLVVVVTAAAIVIGIAVLGVRRRMHGT